MLHIRDTFLHFLADNLDDLSVHHVVRDPDSPGSDLFATNSVNVEFLGVDFAKDISSQQVSIDVIMDSAESAITAVKAVWDLLDSAFYTPLYDYTDPDNPTVAGGNVMWDNRVQFRLIHSENYTHYSALLNLRFH